MYEIDSEPSEPLEFSSDIDKHLYRSGWLMFQAQSADFRLRRCGDLPEEDDNGSESSLDLPDGREIIQIVGRHGVAAGLVEMDMGLGCTQRSLCKPQSTAEAAPDEKQHHFIGLSAGRFPFSWIWQRRIPSGEGDPDLPAASVVNVMLID
jgi:hypothetical protein